MFPRRKLRLAFLLCSAEKADLGRKRGFGPEEILSPFSIFMEQMAAWAFLVLSMSWSLEFHITRWVREDII